MNNRYVIILNIVIEIYYHISIVYNILCRSTIYALISGDIKDKNIFIRGYISITKWTISTLDKLLERRISQRIFER